MRCLARRSKRQPARQYQETINDIIIFKFYGNVRLNDYTHAVLIVKEINLGKTK